MLKSTSSLRRCCVTAVLLHEQRTPARRTRRAAPRAVRVAAGGAGRGGAGDLAAGSASAGGVQAVRCPVRRSFIRLQAMPRARVRPARPSSVDRAGELEQIELAQDELAMRAPPAALSRESVSVTTSESTMTATVQPAEPVPSELQGCALAGALLAAGIGNFLEWLDFALFGMFADQVRRCCEDSLSPMLSPPLCQHPSERMVQHPCLSLPLLPPPTLHTHTICQPNTQPASASADRGDILPESRGDVRPSPLQRRCRCRWRSCLLSGWEHASPQRQSPLTF